MKSQSKTPVSFEAAEKVIAKHLGTSKKITTFEELKDGAFNAAYYLRLEDGFQCVLKRQNLETPFCVMKKTSCWPRWIQCAS